MDNEVKIITLKFKNKIGSNEVKWFRGAIIKNINKDNILFHNHTSDNYRYSYPLIQYKRISGCAAIICIEKGAEAIGDLFANYKDRLLIGNRSVNMEIDFMKPSIITIKEQEEMNQYYIKRWIPLNSKNYIIYNEIKGLAEKIEFLERILIGNILSFTKGLNIYINDKVKCEITDIDSSYTITNKGIKMTAFDMKFACNISIPDNIGLGKNASIDCGIVSKLTDY